MGPTANPKDHLSNHAYLFKSRANFWQPPTVLEVKYLSSRTRKRVLCLTSLEYVSTVTQRSPATFSHRKVGEWYQPESAVCSLVILYLYCPTCRITFRLVFSQSQVYVLGVGVGTQCMKIAWCYSIGVKYHDVTLCINMLVILIAIWIRWSMINLLILFKF